MSDAFETIVGKVCVERGWVSRDQLVDCLRHVAVTGETPSPEGSRSRLTDMLVSRGLVAQDRMAALREEISRILASDSSFTVVQQQDLSLGHLLVQGGTCTKGQLIEALSIQQHFATKGATVPRLGEILIQKGYATFAALESALKAQKEKTVLSCAPCRVQYAVTDHSLKKKYLCKKCSGPLLLPGETPTDLPEEVLAAQKNPKAVIGKYVVTRLLGRGGMGAVHQAWDTVLKRWVAIKVLMGTGAKEELIRFRREAQTAASLRHPNIVGIYEVTDLGDKHVIVMEYIDGKSLAGERLPALKAAEIVTQVAHAVEYAHSKGIIHRDLKPHNIMLDREGKPYVMDFGLAKSLEGHSQITMSGTVVGTPSYMSPEQASGKAALVGKHSDVYSLGAVLYECLTGKAPFKGPNPVETLRMVVHEDVVPPSRLNGAVEKDLETIVLKCLEKDRDRRYSSAKQLATDLERFSGGREISARRAAPVARLMRQAKRQWAPLAAVGGALAVLAAVVLFIALSGPPKGAADVRGLLAKAERLVAQEKLKEALLEVEAARRLDPKNVDVARRAKQIQGRLDELASADTARRDAARAGAQPELDQARAKLQRARTAFYQPGADLSRTDPLLAEAIDHVTKALALWPDNADAFHLRGQAYQLRQNSAAAEMEYSAAIGALKSYSAAYYDRARVYLEMAAETSAQSKLGDRSAEDEARGFRDKARADLEAYRTQSGGDPEQMEFAEAMLAYSELDFRKAVSICDRLVGRRTTNEEVYRVKGDAYSELGYRATNEGQRTDAYSQAVAAYGEALQRRFHYPEAVLERGHVLLHAGRRDDSQVDLDRAAAFQVGGARWHAQRAAIFYEAGRFQEAQDDYRRALAEKPGDLRYLAGFGTILYAKRDYRLALEQFDRILAVAPKNASALSNRALCRMSLNDLDGALTDVAAAALIEPALPDLAYRQGMVHLARKEYAKAEEALGRQLGSRTDDDRALYARGQARFALARFAGALADWEHVARIGARYPDIQKRIADAKAKLGT